MNKILIYSRHNSQAISYMFREVFENFLGLDFRVTQEIEEAEHTSLPVISYGVTEKAIPYIPESGLLLNPFENYEDYLNYVTQYLKHLKYNPTDKTETFDILAVCFFFLSRFEEFQPSEKDMFGRFQATETLLYTLNLCQKPIVDIAVSGFQIFLSENYPNLVFKKKDANVLLTFDIDIAWKYRAKPWKRHWGNLLRDTLTMNFLQLNDRISVLTGRKKDDYDVYDMLEQLKRETGLSFIFFFHVLSQGKYDKAVDCKSAEFKQLVKKISEFAEIGIHPSFAGGQSAQRIVEEKSILEQITGLPVTKSRHHFLKLHIPETVHALSESGITDDYTMVFASHLCKRAATNAPFQFFDLQQNKALSVKLHPVTYMDGTLREYMNLSKADAREIISSLWKDIQQYGGEFIPIWHNNSLCETEEWKGWKTEVFDFMISIIMGEKQ